MTLVKLMISFFMCFIMGNKIASDKMKIVLIAGDSGTGKTTLSRILCQQYPDIYNFINGYTDREQRDTDEWGHFFVGPEYMRHLLSKCDIAAQTKIQNAQDCTLRTQFDDVKINIYIVDKKGMDDVAQSFPKADIITVLIKREQYDIDIERKNRNVIIPDEFDVDFVINNDDITVAVQNLHMAITSYFIDKIFIGVV